MNKPRPVRSLAVLAHGLLAETFARQGFAQSELVTRWPEIAGPEIAAHAEPLKIRWSRMRDGEPQEPATLVLRVEGPAAIEIQHMAGVLIERVNRFFGWQAVGQIALRQAPLARRAEHTRRHVNGAEAERIAESITEISDDNLRQALGKLGAALKQG